VPWLKEVHAKVLQGTLHGGIKGAAAGAAASIASGAAVVVTVPAWLPVVGSTALITTGTIGLWSTIGGGLGASVNGARAYLRFQREKRRFQAEFPPVQSNNNHSKEST
jgi:hypothetical protein